MNAIVVMGRRTRRFVGRVLSTGVALGLLGAACTPAYAGVAVDSAPLTVQSPIPPNIVLMLDDSGSMAWDVMPDYGYLADTSAEGLTDASVNGLYYNPSVTYAPPLQADGKTSYPNATLTSAWIDGFNTGRGTVDLTKYDGSKDSSDNRTNYYYYQSAIPYSSANGQVNTFRYTTGPAGGPYVTHYVGSTSCGSLAVGSCVLAGDTSGVSAPQGVPAGQNVANWYAYYHTRMLMAKSGVMNAFSTVDVNYRIGFGSIDGNNKAALGGDYYPFTTSIGSTNYSSGLAIVKAFGDGSTGTQKKLLWNWLVGTSANGGTPLRGALDSVGKYLQTAAPWTTVDSTGQSTELACRQSYTILTTDGFWNGTTPSAIGDQDGVAGTEINSPNGQSFAYSPTSPYIDNGTPTATTKSYSAPAGSRQECKQTYNSVTGSNDGWQNSYYSTWFGGWCSFTYTSYSGSGSSYQDTLADVAMKYWKTDLRPNTPNEVPTSAQDLDPAFWQHMTTFTLGMGFKPVDSHGTTQTSDDTPIDTDAVFNWARGGAPIANFGWPKPAADSLNNIADLAHAALDGHGGFYSATNPQAFASALRDSLKRAETRVGTGASLAANSTSLDTGTVAYQAHYFTSKWKGDLQAYSVNSATGAIATTPNWTASTVLPTPANRNIHTYDMSTGSDVLFANGTGSTGVAAPPSLASAQLTALGADATAQMNMVDYLRGVGTLEQRNGGSFRNRETPLGDIVDSQPVYVGAPNANEFLGQTFTGSDTFVAYASAQAAREPLIFVASNDGYVHAFDGKTGVEAYAYLPGAVIKAGLKSLSDPAYGTGSLPHQYFNDGELTVADVYLGAGTSQASWHTVLVGTTGRGTAKAVYALDVTDPSSIKLLWERSAGDDKDGNHDDDFIGQMAGKPVIAQTANGTWSVLIGNGYNSTKGQAALLQFALSDGSLSVHTTTDTTVDNGLAAPAVWIGALANGISTTAYAGDLHGNVWSFTLYDSSSTTTTTTGIVGSTPDSQGVLLYTAKDANLNVQPITGGMLVGKDPATGNLWLFFGTGKYLSDSDLTDLSVQTWYGLIADSTTGTAIQAADTRSSLAQRSIAAETTAVQADPSASPPVEGRLATRAVTSPQDAVALADKPGWYIDLVSPINGKEGERMVTPNQFEGNQLLGTTRIPEAVDACNPSGRGWIMAIDPFTGTASASSFFDINGDGQINADDEITVGGKTYPASGAGFDSLPNNPIFVGSSMLVSFDNGSNSSLHTAGSSASIKRVSWRELINQ